MEFPRCVLAIEKTSYAGRQMRSLLQTRHRTENKFLTQGAGGE